MDTDSESQGINLNEEADTNESSSSITSPTNELNESLQNVEEEQEDPEEQFESPIENMDKLNNYYRLKEKYENNKNELKSVIMKNTTLNRRSKKASFLNQKPKCVNCKRRVGTKFSNKYNAEDDSRTFLAICGDTENPCRLNIELKLTAVYILNDIIRNEKQKMNENQNQIIAMKNNLLFGYEINTDMAMQQFGVITQEIEEQTKIIETNLLKLLNIIKNPAKIQNIKQMQKDFYNYVAHFKEIIRRYETSPEENKKTEYIHNAFEYYRDTIHPNTTLLANLKYSMMRVNNEGEDESTTNKYILEQKQFTVNMLETTNNKDMITVVHYVVGGIAQEEETPVQPQQTTKSRPKPKQTTRKQRRQPEPEQITEEQVTPQEQPENDLFNAIDAIQKSLTQEEKENITINNIIAKLRNDYNYEDTVLQENKPAIKKYVMDTF